MVYISMVETDIEDSLWSDRYE